ncbi:VOC family protein [Pseudidiomarina sp. 1APP75-32.1]|uniref:VOC family protein n=1 Tax=Pseudidiomarina terrestris TaxID=2820060 RepID=A0AAW7QY06_9GAMM|nr:MULTISPECIES: VOC family protein [unclassified Pseudidiomarina]MDN7123953.1 VOC family protein [Pseudidiomarina sp. 1APP75-32.1]MDN7127707.1 VOC family protein [Pseudidiomarina sp. 1APR75-33.1]MDN7130453.1 VOC family protein [Pseudidiomarina sp. 1APR75-15]MDN7138707.1 VOC family protein [Pseudidiomarina sp. 1ASP75-14]MEA3588830.1 VOC family protein [Pseudidiomarina sp. 1APP75-27a]
MQAAISYITLGVDDLERAVAFYRDVLGLPTEGIVGAEYEQGAVAFFKMVGGLTFALWERDSIAHDCGVTKGTPDPTALMLAHNVASAEEVDTIMSDLPAAAVVKPPRKLFWGGYGGVFSDPDGHLWEVVYNPKHGA